MPSISKTSVLFVSSSLLTAILVCGPFLPNLASAKESELESGKKLFAENNCQVCHVAEDRGGCLAPPLDGLREYRSRAYVIGRITMGDKFLKQPPLNKELMPHPRLPLTKSAKIASYILSLKAPPGGYKVYGHDANDKLKSEEKVAAPFNEVKSEKAKPLPAEYANLEKGRKIFLSAGCLACHSVGGLGGRFAPDLKDIGGRRTTDYIQRKLSNASLKSGEELMSMPPSHLSKEEIEQLSAFLSTLR